MMVLVPSKLCVFLVYANLCIATGRARKKYDKPELFYLVRREVRFLPNVMLTWSAFHEGVYDII